MIASASSMPGDRRIENIAGAAEFRIELRAVLAAIERRDAEALHQQLQREDFLRRREIADNSADARRPARL